MLLAVSRVNETVPLFLVDGLKRRLARCAAARSRCSAWPSSATPTTSATRSPHKLVRLLERELADVAVHDPHVATPDRRLEDALDDADVVVVATNHCEFSTPEALRAIADRAGADCLVVDPWNALGAAPGLRLPRRGRGAAGA